MPTLGHAFSLWLTLVLAAAAEAQDVPAWQPLREGALELTAPWELLTDTTYGLAENTRWTGGVPGMERAPPRPAVHHRRLMPHKGQSRVRDRP